MSPNLRLPIRTDSEASRAALQATAYLRAEGLEHVTSQMIATAVSELARNIVKYAGTGEIWVRRIEGERGRGIEVEAVDEGPGIEDPEAALRDHVSTGGTLGLGLPGVRRLMDEFTLESVPGQGTRVTARKWL